MKKTPNRPKRACGTRKQRAIAEMEQHARLISALFEILDTRYSRTGHTHVANDYLIPRYGSR